MKLNKKSFLISDQEDQLGKREYKISEPERMNTKLYHDVVFSGYGSLPDLPPFYLMREKQYPFYFGTPNVKRKRKSKRN